MNDLDSAIAQQMRGELEGPIARYEQVLKTNPDNHRALHFLGLALFAKGELDRACELVTRSITLNPGKAMYHSNYGFMLQEQGQFEGACAQYELALRSNPKSIEIRIKKANAHLSLAENKRAKAECAAALAIDRDNEGVYLLLAKIDLQEKKYESAEAKLISALKKYPNARKLQFALISVLAEQDRFIDISKATDFAIKLDEKSLADFVAEARRYIEQGQFEVALSIWRAMAINPGADLAQLKHESRELLRVGKLLAAQAFSNLALERGQRDQDSVILSAGIAYKLKRYEESFALYDELEKRFGTHVESLFGRGSSLMGLLRQQEAILDFDRCLKLDPFHMGALINRGTSYLDLGEFEQAVENFDKALEIDPKQSGALLNKALIRLASDDYLVGFREYEWGWEAGVRGSKKNTGIPYWLGNEVVSGRRLLVTCEQGLGDVIQFCRFLDGLTRLGADVTFSLRPALHGLLAPCFPAVKIIGEDAIREADFDYHISLMSIPHALRVTINDVNPRSPYLTVGEPAIDFSQFNVRQSSFKIGLCSYGGRGTPIDVGRSIDLDRYAEIAKLDGVSLFHLNADRGDALKDPVLHERLIQLPTEFDRQGAFVDTARLIKGLDLVITSDTSIAHLAGALGCPVWVILKKVPDWRWGLNRDYSPWYSSMQLFRQRDAGDWSTPIAEVVRELRAYLRSREAQ